MTVTNPIDTGAFTPLPLAGVVADLLPPIELYLPAVPSQKPVLYRARTAAVNESDLQLLQARGIDELWVSGDEQNTVAEFLANNLATLLANETQPPAARAKLLNQVVSQTLKDSMSCDDPASSVIASQDLAKHLVELGTRSDLTIRDVAKVARHDLCTFTHSANVACYSTMLAKALGVNDEQELQAIATAGMLHDLGKLEIPTAILNKPGRLTNEEFTQIKLHPVRGFQMLRKEFTLPQLMLVYQHHEKMDGSGYPVACTGVEIHWWARICAVADVYEALTGKRPYRRPNTANEALLIMRRGSGTHFDRDIFQCWQSHFQTELAP
ncbi:HD-GYP domain-containing protein [Anatilimnocola floriformis]|uniref:HD-GYP domain-containing protein n=1 Tax=Anatilimnocola floriformis TaxID=2948575 RepID=UPI0020C34308|nr:HD-GYP domain-containing protein [Anatilimnocola floriformis]